MIDLSILDLAPIAEGQTTADALATTLTLAREAEAAGYVRYWLAEHHNMPGLACSATAVLIGHVAGGTQRIKVGSGGVMLPNHAPLVVAEQFGTLATLYPGRIELGLGRAPGTDPATARALRRHLTPSGHDEDAFARDVLELCGYLAPASQNQAVRAIPGMGTNVPVWLLGSSLYSAQLAAHLGFPFAFASHFAPDLLLDALEVYRRGFRPSERWPTPHAMVAVNVIAAETDEEANHLFTSLQQRFLGIVKGERGPLPRPVTSMAGRWSEPERLQVQRMLACSAVGGPERVIGQLNHLLDVTQADELIIAGAMHDTAARLRSLRIVAGLREQLGTSAMVA